MASVITLDMIRAFAAAEEISLEDGTQFPGVVGSLETWETGHGELDSNIVGGDNEALFKPLVDAFNAAVAASQAAGSGEGTQDKAAE